MDHPPIKDSCLILPTGPVPIPPGLLTSKAFTKSGVIDGRSHAGKALRGWVQEQIAEEAAKLERGAAAARTQGTIKRHTAFGVVEEAHSPGMPPEAPQKPQDSQFAPEGVDHPSEAEAAPAGSTEPPEAMHAFGMPGGHTGTWEGEAPPPPEGDVVHILPDLETPAPAATTPADQNPQPQPAPLPFGDMPRLGSHESAKRLVEIIIELYPDAKPIDWRSCQAMLANAQRYGTLWSQKTRK